jgi:hypothetical protein
VIGSVIVGGLSYVASQAYARGFQLKAYALDNRKNITNE